MPVTVSLGAGAEPFDPTTVRFVPPKDIDSDTFLCKAYAPGGGKQALRVVLPGAAVVRAAESRRQATTLHLHVPRRVTRFLMDLDAHMVATAQTNSGDWFAVQMNPSLIEEYYHGSCAPDRQHGVLARVVLDGPAPPECQPGSRVDLELQLLGIQFRRQYFTAAWRVVSATRAPAAGAAAGFLFADDGDDDTDAGSGRRDSDSDAGDDDDEGPSFEERVAMHDDLLRRAIDRHEQLHTASLELLEVISNLRNAKAGDLAAVEAAAERLDALSVSV